MANSDRQTDERENHNLREKTEGRKNELLERWWFF